MYCNQCGYQHQEDFRFCPRCGAEVRDIPPQSACHGQEPCRTAPVSTEAYQEPVGVDPVSGTFLSLLQDNLFFVICILMTACCATSVLMGSLQVVDILITVFLWLTYAQAGKNVADAGYLRCVSGAVYANYIITNVVAAILAVCGLILGATFSLFAGFPAFLEGLQQGLAASGMGELGVDLTAITDALAILPGFFFVIVFLVAGGLVLVFNLFTNRYLHRFAKSVYTSIQSGSFELKHASAARVVLIIFAVFCGIDALDCLTCADILGLISYGADCAACILSVLLMNKYLFPKN